MNCRQASYPSIRSHPLGWYCLAAFASLALVQNELKAATLELDGSLVHLLPPPHYQLKAALRSRRLPPPS